MTPEQKERIDHYVSIYIAGVKSVSNDAGWEQKSIMGKIVDFAGDLPPPSGYDQSNMTMINAIRLLRERHAKWPIISGAVKTLIYTRPAQIYALLAKHALVGTCPYTDRAWSDAERAEELNQSLDSFRYNVKIAYPLMHRELEVAQRYCEFYGI
jgi:hypothetical protein